MRKHQTQIISLPINHKRTRFTISNFDREFAEECKVTVNQPRVSPCHKNCLTQIAEQRILYNNDKQLQSNKDQMSKNICTIQYQNKMMQDLQKSIKQTLSQDENTLHQKNKLKLNIIHHPHHKKTQSNNINPMISNKQPYTKTFNKNVFSEYYQSYQIEYI
ncbi:hypothetical protein TTHERM_000474679 (macronuclear) [Tetrahymena thermophila SB210]|uniref:Uncharacterized protein n=1 Tax=Tetrahymena thermophila (strain SB210) TaxID=312017 RepID=W7X3L2_TETTS|nr:hypothetical protein TTHERM_000474679 [Tetrahymena thermophila SB210]EWS72047.1 hypothetical protein TTHERM_000474679 [Tetrahymena thermophila SB210]|eukprot:XP_012655422.1 hypothetical protein TTHERM_000474679 [Tetrahymena thermophila SB210]